MRYRIMRFSELRESDAGRIHAYARLSAVILLAPLLLVGCAMRMVPPVPAGMLDQAQVKGFPEIRDWGDARSTLIEQSIIKAWEQRKQHGEVPSELHILAISGGGTDGAYGAGLLCGWTAAGTRPRFDIVTGISTGALIAPFAFVGPAQDHKLRTFYTSVTTRNLLQLRGFLATITSDALGDSDPLARLVEKVVDADFLRAVAREHATGRRLFIGTTNLDAQRPVIWDMGAIAASGHPDSLHLFRQVMLASSSIPAIYPPQYFDVEVAGKRYQEMHVDGGAVAQVFHIGQVLDYFKVHATLRGLAPDAPHHLHVIRNGQMRPEWQAVEPRVLPIAQRSVATLLKANAAGAIYRIYTLSRLENADFNLAYVPDNFVSNAAEALDTSDMRRLFDLGYAAGKSGDAWVKTPPGLVTEVSREAAGAVR